MTDLQVEALYKLGPQYRNQLRFPHEAGHKITVEEREALYFSNLSEKILISYNPAAVDGNLTLESSPSDSVSSFVHTPHAQLLNGVEAVEVKSLKQALHSIGGLDAIWPLFGQIDIPQSDGTVNYELVPMLVDLVGRLLSSSGRFRQQALHERGFLLVAQALEKSSSQHLSLGSATCLQEKGSETSFLAQNLDRLLDRDFQGRISDRKAEQVFKTWAGF